MNDYSSSLGKIIQALKCKRISVFCGAGISYNSGLPIVSELLEYLFSKLELTTSQAASVYESNLPFESIMEMVLRESSLDEIQDIFTSGLPNANHILLAKLAKHGFLSTIYTTNFDVLIERALEDEGLLSGRNFKVHSSESDFNSIDWRSDCINIIKIHGCASKKAEMAITMSLIASDKYSAMRKNLLYQIFGTIRISSVMVLGYSCSDLDLTPLIESFTGKIPQVIFIEHQTSNANCFVEPVSFKSFKNPFRNYEGLRIYIDTKKIVKDIWEKVLTDQYINDQHASVHWKDNIDQWYLKSVEESGNGVKHHIAGRLLYAVAEFNQAIQHNKSAIKIAMDCNNLLAYSSETGNMAMALSAIGDNDQAKLCLEESIPLCRRIGHLESLSSQLQAYGNVLHRTGDDHGAIKAHKEALNYAESQNDRNAISTILGNISNSYNKLQLFDDAEKALNRALLISRELGNKQAESSQLGILGGTYMYMGNLEKALENCLKAVEIKRMLGERQGECLLLANIINLYRLLNRNKKAAETAEECIALARKIGNKQVETMAILNMALL